jgi:hypothetical protein
MYVSVENPVTQEIRNEENKKIKTFFPTKHLITRWFNIFNQEIFNDAIYPFHKIEIKRKHGCHAEHIPFEEKDGNIYACLSIADRFNNKNEFLFTLAHEMVHQWQWMHLYRTSHGESFWKWKSRLSQFEIPLGVSI